MKSLRYNLHRSLGVLGLAVLLSATPAQAAALKVFLLGGQSNMDGRAATSDLPTELQNPQTDVLLYSGSTLTTLQPGSGSDFGTEVSFGRTVADAYPAESFALIKYGVGGTDLHFDADGFFPIRTGDQKPINLRFT